MPPLPDSLLKGEPVQIITTTDDHSFELDEETLQKILYDGQYKDKNVCVLSVAGAFRKGKSFLLDFFLRFLNNEGKPDWLGREDEPLSGFTWRGGSERETTGIWAWNKLFLRKMDNGEEVAVMLMDTQGAFDSESTVKDCATVFALSTMTSSVQVYNLSQNIQENDLQHLQLFTEYGRLAMEKTTDKPFQSLMFLVRDWSYPYEFPYGTEGGERVLERKLKTGNNRHEELERVRIHIGSCFDRINCFLMPHPGLAVARKRDFDGRLSDVDKEFVEYLKELAPLLLAPSNLIVKKINGTNVTCKALYEYIKAYVKVYQSSELPEPKTMLQATAEANNLAAVAQARDHYVTEMEKVCGGDQSYISPDELEEHHGKILAAAMDLFNSCKKMGGEEFSQSYSDNLITEIEEKYEQYIKHNDSKNLFNVARSPITLVTTMLLMYILSGLFGLLGIYSCSNMANILLGISLMTLCTWSYCRYSGQYTEVGTFIDNAADVMWLQMYAPIYKKMMQSPGSSRKPRKKD